MDYPQPLRDKGVPVLRPGPSLAVLLNLAPLEQLARILHPFAAATILLFPVALAPNGLVAQSSSGCLPADTIFVPWRLDYFKKLVSSKEPTDSTVRAQLGISLASASKVSLVTAAQTCVSAISAINARLNEPNAVRQVWVFTLGGGDYAVEDPALDKEGSEWMPVFILDRRFNFKGILSGW